MGRGEGRKRRRTMRKSSDFNRWSTIPRSGEHIAQGEVDCLPHDGGHEEPAGSQLEIPDAQEVPRGGQRVPVPDGTQVPSGAQQMPESFTIGTKNAFKGNYAFEYKKWKIDEETIYICSKGSAWDRKEEVLVLRYEEGKPITKPLSMTPASRKSRQHASDAASFSSKSKKRRPHLRRAVGRLRALAQGRVE